MPHAPWHRSLPFRKLLERPKRQESRPSLKIGNRLFGRRWIGQPSLTESVPLPFGDLLESGEGDSVRS
jgi:hypothetical protein